MTLPPLLRLMRLHQPVGIWLLLLPCLWSLALYDASLPLYLWFALGAVLMRSAGCVINDIVDRDFDRRVARTTSRPLASGELRIEQAYGILAVLLFGALIVALALGWNILLWAATALPLVAAYPWMKRITYWPQAFLGLTFNWGALLGSVAATGNITPAALWLYIGGVFWTLAYDTIYAFQDMRDDAEIGVKSTALLFKNYPKLWVSVFYLLALLCWSAAGLPSLGLLITAIGFALIVAYVEPTNPQTCLKGFKANALVGAILFFSQLL